MVLCCYNETKVPNEDFLNSYGETLLEGDQVPSGVSSPLYGGMIPLLSSIVSMEAGQISLHVSSCEAPFKL